MKRISQKLRRKSLRGSVSVRANRRRHSTAAAVGDDRRGTIIVIVLALLGALSLMGFLIYSIAAEDEVSAEYFADAGKVTDPGIDPNSFFNFTLRQIILGADFNEKQSALWGGRHSLLPTMLGRDFAPYSGEGVNLVWSGTGPVVDRDFNGADDGAPASNLLAINLSAAARGGLLDLNDLNNDGTTGDFYPEPDADYTAPDINSSFIAYDALVPSGTADPVRVIKPSYHVPQILRGVVTPDQWYNDVATAGRVLHPHKEHMAFPTDWNNGDPAPTKRRFVSDLYPDVDAGVTLHNFPFPGDLGVDLAPGVVGIDDDGANGIDDAGEIGYPGSDDGPPVGAEGVWAASSNINYGADPDGDGIYDGFWIDLDFPIMEIPATGTKFIAMAAISIKDADALLNLNVHGNAEGDWALDAGTSQFAGPSQFLSRSNQGAGPWEVNPEWALNARPVAAGPDFAGPQADLDTALEQYRLLFRNSASRLPPANNPTNNLQTGDYELANMDLWRLKHGGAQIVDPGAGVALDPASIQQGYPGLWGEQSNLLTGPSGVILSGRGTTNPTNGPAPGFTVASGSTNPDDNHNGTDAVGQYDEGGQWIYGATVDKYTPFVYPVDYFGGGRTTDSSGTNYGRQREMAVEGNHTWPVHRKYKANPKVGLFYAPGATLPIFNKMMPAAAPTTLINEPSETVVTPNAVGLLGTIQKADAIFGPDELIGHLPDSIFKTKLNSPGRAAKLASFNFVGNDRAAEIRKRFTSQSWDLKSFGKNFTPLAGNAGRLWEFNADTDADSLGEFPPLFGNPTPVAANLQPFRAEVRDLLTLEPGDRLRKIQRLLSVNGILDRTPNANGTPNPNGRLRFRPLMHHPTNLAATPVAAQPTITTPEQLTGDLAQQEWLARYDRQRMARDIYVLLYTLGGANDGQDYATTAGDTLYPGKQREEMAQFAVNVVDALDPDDVITQFVYDRDLSDGWDLADEYRYDDSGTPAVNTERGIVFGVERQILALNEAMVLLCKRVLDSSMMPMDHTATQYNDTEHRSYTYVELENVSPFTVDFANNGWQILIKQANVTAGTTYVGERRLILRSGNAPIPAGANSRFSIGTAGDGQDVDAGTVRPSFAMVDPNNASAFQRIAPRGSLDLDLMLTPFTDSKYIVTQPLLPTAPLPEGFGGDGEVATSVPTDPAGGELLDLPANDTDYDGLTDGDVEVEIQLRRRANLQRVEPSRYNTGDGGAA
ncbi:MAG: hypothetical protein AB7O26_15025, partial [Planctomycetaceae bacterium]